MAPDSARRRWFVTALGVVLVFVAAPLSHGVAASPEQLPAAGELVTWRAAVRAAPVSKARLVRVLPRFRCGGEFQGVVALRAWRCIEGWRWYEMTSSGRPSRQRCWVRGDLVDLRPVVNRIVVHVAARRIEV